MSADEREEAVAALRKMDTSKNLLARSSGS
jgi:hypothetical protein